MIRSLRYKLVLLILPLCLVPLVVISTLSYFTARERITEDRIVLYLEQIAQNVADTLSLILLEKKEEAVSMGLHSELRDFLLKRSSAPPQLLLDKLLIVHQVYDLIVLFDVEGRILLSNQIDRNRILDQRELDPEQLQMLHGQSLLRYTPDSSWLQQVRSGRLGYIDWHLSPLVHRLYNYLDDDISRHYSIGFAAPILDEQGIVAGGLLALMNWEHVQEILDKVEEDLEERSLTSGYAFLFGNDGNTIVGHKYRRNRKYHRMDAVDLAVAVDNYGTRLIEEHGLQDLQEAVVTGESHFRYEYPRGTAKISGLAAINHEHFHWVCGVGIDDSDIFAPVQTLKNNLIVSTSLFAFFIVLLTYGMARRITIPLKKLTQGAGVIEAGDYSHRVEIGSRDEIGELAKTFNKMAHSLQERSHALLDLNKKLEEKVRERTRELELKNQELEKAYQDLKETQVQLIQSEKMASLGQLVAGIAHEIKNPLNFIYGNTEFLARYVESLKQLIQLYEEKTLPGDGERKEIEALKKRINYSFLVEDLDTLIRNFDDGARRIHAIIDDLRTFSRMESDQFRKVGIQEPIDLALNLLQNLYRDRIRIHKEYHDVPPLECHPGKLSQVFMNLLSNACQAIAGEGDIWIRTFAENSRVIVEVEDNGAGIDREHLPRVFEPFFTTKSVGQGTGLGLSISYGIVQQHQGTIEVDSKEGKGTTFRVSLPVKP